MLTSSSSSSSSSSSPLTNPRLLQTLFFPVSARTHRFLHLLPPPPPRLSSSRTFASLSSSHRHQQEEELDGCDHLIGAQQEDHSRFVHVKAFFLCTAIDLKALQGRNGGNVIPPNSRATNYVVLRFRGRGVRDGLNGLKAALPKESNCCYMVVFQYGSVVLFNVSDGKVDGYLKIVKEHASGLLPEIRKDDYAVVEKPALETWMEGGLDYVMLKSLSLDGIRTIGSVLGQSIALDHYIRQVDGMVAEFTVINHNMEKTGTFSMQRKKLFQLVGKANSNLADVILKLRLLESCRSCGKLKSHTSANCVSLHNRGRIYDIN